MPKGIALHRLRRALIIAFLMTVASGWPLRAADLPLATGSPLAGFEFDDRPLVLPVQENFQMALLTASSELGRSCGKTEAYGWRMKQTEQRRVDQIFDNTVDRLRGLGYVVETQSPSSISHDITLFTADRPDKHFVFMWSAGEIGLVMVLCESSPPLINHTGTKSFSASMPMPTGSISPHEVFASELKEPVENRGARAAAAHFSPVGRWTGSYTCMQGYTGGTLDINSLKGKNFTGVFRFYPTAKNPRVPPGSYAVYGQYDPASQRVLINPGKWIVRPHGYYNTIIVGGFDPLTRTFSGYFQGITGCTSFEARYANPVYAQESTGRTKTAASVRKKHAVKKKTNKKLTVPAAAPAAALSPEPAMPAISNEPAVNMPASGTAGPTAAPAVVTPPASSPPPQAPLPANETVTAPPPTIPAVSLPPPLPAPKSAPQAAPSASDMVPPTAAPAH